LCVNAQISAARVRILCGIMDTSGTRAGSVALLVLSAVTGLACVAAIGAATTLVFMAAGESGPSISLAAYDANCPVVAWKSGTTHCFRNIVASAR
jgi:hypothetical protein